MNEDYYSVLLAGKVVVHELSVLRPECLLLFKAKGEHIDSRDIKKHKNDILRIAMEFVLEKIEALPENIHTDMKEFIEKLKEELFDKNLLKDYGLSNGDVAERLQQLYL